MNKIYYLFAGVNGAGETTLYETQDLNNLVKIIPFCDIINIYDNTGSNDYCNFRRIYSYKIA